MKILVIVKSIHHQNTVKIAKVIADVLNAEIKTPREVNPEELKNFDLIGFGSGIYSDTHHKAIFNLVDTLPQVTTKKAFIFSTSGSPGRFAEEFRNYTSKCHIPLKEKLQSHGYKIIGEFSCPGFNTNSFIKFFGGLNRGRPNAEDFKRAKEFALNLKQESFEEVK
ncbi:MAG: flavodoxin [Candidatus Heimdallarchaeota archaeon]|nr:flavodoxin [Candidatus Heimdallarchaeota archaeon]